ncbi:hypothetical protein, partial [Klebsiella pneumoniae]|uniref:hypothetical protein n=1 Tax=Klebsiella pneumoniae TaxID=573 RepID=UPI00272F9692
YQSVRYFTNAVDTQTRGVDITGQHRYRFDNGGRLNSTVGYSYAKTRVTDIKVTRLPEQRTVQRQQATAGRAPALSVASVSTATACAL